jgi:ParB-like chromosome segregation protein Spo0J
MTQPSHGAAPAWLEAILRSLLAPIVREAVADAIVELRASERHPAALLTREQVAQSLGVSLATIARLSRDGCPRVFVGDSPRFRLDALLHWIEERNSAGGNG